MSRGDFQLGMGLTLRHVTRSVAAVRIPLIMIAQSGDCDHAFDGS